MKTAVTDLLDAHGIAYRELPHDSEVLAVEAAAQQRGVNPDEMIKSILLRDKKKRYVMACVLGFDKLNTQALRDYAEVSRLSFASPAEIEAITGFPVGAVAPIAHRTAVPVVCDVSIQSCDTVNISSGHRLMGLELAASDLISLVENLVWGDIRATE